MTIDTSRELHQDLCADAGTHIPRSHRPWRTYEVSVQGFPPSVRSAPSRGAAIYSAYLDFSSTYDCKFGDFLRIARARNTASPSNDGYDYVRRQYGVDVRPGDRITLTGEGARLEGRGATVIYPGRSSTSMVHCVIDGYERSSLVHPLSVVAARDMGSRVAALNADDGPGRPSNPAPAPPTDANHE